ncbi:MAG: DUF4369 domain-containing protein [Bacteroidaceae bacterium]|nr:DUF4369 domain-containing protein [Bacteroidaceae bacterium]
MNKIIICLIGIVAVFTSCMGSYDVKGSSSMSSLDGRMLYMKGEADDEMLNIDSCDILNGEFHFSGSLDTVKMVNLFIGEQWLMPFVLEAGPIQISLSSTDNKVSGTPLNDKLYKFLARRMQIHSQMEELSHQETQAIMNGEDVEELQMGLFRQAQDLTQELDMLETSFITENFDNVLGPTIFQTICSAFQYPMLTPQIEDIMSRATPKFKNDPFVKDYYQAAQTNMRLMQGYDPQDLDNLPLESNQ